MRGYLDYLSSCVSFITYSDGLPVKLVLGEWQELSGIIGSDLKSEMDFAPDTYRSLIRLWRPQLSFYSLCFTGFLRTDGVPAPDP